jgi:4-hydroxybenzoate polyprenyltransferase
MFLNDAFDSEYDQQYRKERPVPSGAITLAHVWGWGFGWLVAGVLLLSLLGTIALVLSLLLVSAILIYDAIHKVITLSPLIMALCRWLLYLLASSSALNGVSGLAIWSGLALAAYVVGLSYLARGERAHGAPSPWAGVLLITPVLLAWIVNNGEYKPRAILLSAILIVWVIRCVRETFLVTMPSVVRTVSGLLAGICLVDLLAVAGISLATGSIFLLLFGIALIGQRFIPAT